MAKSSGKVTIKKYANRRLYDTESSTYITLDRLAQMVREGREFEVVDAKTGAKPEAKTAGASDMEQLKAELAALQAKVDRLSR